ncbi:MAG: UMP kinase [Patescibacteria group bacterium]
MKKPIVLSVGGSIVVPESGIDVEYLKKLRSLILQEVEKGERFIIVVGGGSVCRKYQNAAKEITDLEAEDLDWLGIHTTRLNAHLLRTIFRDIAHPVVSKNPTIDLDWKEPVLIAAGWKPGCSTDFDAVMLAQKCGAEQIINLTNVDAVYEEDPKVNPDAKSYEHISWADFRKIVGSEWSPGANAPFDPIASKLAQEQGMKVVIARGTDIDNLQDIIDGKEFKGTLISGE